MLTKYKKKSLLDKHKEISNEEIKKVIKEINTETGKVAPKKKK